MMMKVPRLMIAAVRSGAGKTSIATGLMGALTARGYRVQGFKVGPDFIDPGYHTAVTGAASRNLDAWLLSSGGVCELFERAVAGKDIAVIEGVMGVFDGLQGGGERGSSAEMAKLLDCPVVLVIDVQAQARSAIAEYLGCRAFDPQLPLAGVILNRVQGSGHLELLRESFREAGNIPVLGAIREGSIPSLKERHLGLVPVTEQQQVKQVLPKLVEAVSAQVDLDGIVRLAASASSGCGSCCKGRSAAGDRLSAAAKRFNIQEPPPPDGERVLLAYAWDEAFHFYYRDGLDLLERLGGDLVPFSPLRDRRLPAGIGGILLGGGFPELFCRQLAENREMMRCLRRAHAEGMPIYAECGGFMYLCRQIFDGRGDAHPMVGLVPGSCRMEKHLTGIGYVEASALSDNVLCRSGEVLRGHEFHYSSFIPDGEPFPWAFSFRKGNRLVRRDGYASGNLLATYLHFHFLSSPQAAARFLASCRSWLKRGGG
jgi:cobyrinic acid a,c-diamide synthase